MSHSAIPRLRPPFSVCLACQEYQVHPQELAVDIEGISSREADSLCGPHRARATEGACVLCGNRWPWVRLHARSGIGACRPCFVARFGEESAMEIEARWEALKRAGSL